jgi:pyruvate,water dikinase
MYLHQLFQYWTLQVFAPGKLLRLKYEAFKELLHQGAQVDWARGETLVRALRWSGAPRTWNGVRTSRGDYSFSNPGL